MASKYNWQDFNWDEMKDDLDKIVALSRYYGSDPDFVLIGGGNTSVKVNDSLFIKASGISLADIDRNGFVELSREKVRSILNEPYSEDPIEREEQVKEKLLESRKDKKVNLRPSVETMLHESICYKFIVHTHPCLINGLTCGNEGKAIAEELFGKTALWINYTDPGYTLAKRVQNALIKYRMEHEGIDPLVIFIQNHGVFVGANDPQSIKDITDDIVNRLNEYISMKKPVPIFKAEEFTIQNISFKDLSPAIRGIISASNLDLKYPIVVYNDSELVMEFAKSESSAELVKKGALTPDQIVYCKRSALWVNLKENLQGTIAELQTSVRKFIKQYSYYPRIIFVQGIGMFAIGDNKRNADNALAVYEDSLKIIRNSSSFGGPHFMNDRQMRFIDEWEVENYRRKIASGTQVPGRVAGKIAIITGAAQGFGEGIARSFADEGAYVIIADINIAGAKALADSINEKYGSGKAMAIKTDITNEDSLTNMVNELLKAYGGIDILVSNAGVLRAGSVKTMSLADFEFVTKVNYTGYFLCVKHISPIMAVQHKYNPEYTSDIVQINSKSGLQGSNKNSAYAGSKFGGIGLTQSFALELIEDGIKVNSICPGNYLDGPLWSDPEKGLFVQYLRAGKVPGAKTIEDVRKAYESKVPMGRGCRVPDVMHAIYYVIDQPYETGQAIVVTGGQLMR